MKLVVFTIVLDGMPFIERHLPTFQQLTISWQWIVVEGAAGNTADTGWCQPQEPRLSRDGTHDYLRSIRHNHFTHIYKPRWVNKTMMCNTALEDLDEPCVLMQIDADEIWTATQLEKIVWLFEQNADLGSIMFGCRYFVGPNLILQGQNCYGDYDYEWLRAWRFHPGDKFAAHEPPLLCQYGDCGSNSRMSKFQSRKLDLVFEHFPYVTEAQVAYKEKFYGYENALRSWRALQNHVQFPVSLSRFFPWVTGQYPKVVRLQ